MNRTISCCLVLLVAGQAVQAADEPRTIEVVVRARAIEEPVLKYRLLPSDAQRKPGNAVPILLRLPWEQTVWMNEVFPKLCESAERPLDSPEWKTTRDILPSHFIKEMERAAFRRDANWEYPLNETQSPYGILLPDVQGLRGFLLYGLTANIRYHLSRGELEPARAAILIGLANSQHLAQTPFYVTQLVAAAIQQAMLDEVAEYISQPQSPNLYWALSTLPASLLELDRAADNEASLFTRTLPALNDLDRTRTREEWRQMAVQLATLLRELGEMAPEQSDPNQPSVMSQIKKAVGLDGPAPLALFVTSARAELPKLLQSTDEQVAAMSDDEVAVRWYALRKFRMDERVGATVVLPPREAWPQLVRLKDDIASFQKQTGAQSQLAAFFNPISIYVATHAPQRKVAALRIIEAVRDYMGRHDGQLPASLDEIDGVPIPLDPLTGEKFRWQVDGNTAVLTGSPLPAGVSSDDIPNSSAFMLEYRLRRE
jgi:hypothetical protein